MTERDQRQNPVRDVTDDREAGEGTKPDNRSTGYVAPASEDDDEPTTPDEIEIAIVDEVIQTERREETVESTVEPGTQLHKNAIGSLAVSTVDIESIDLARVEQSVSRRVRPTAAETESESFDITVVETVSTETESESVENRVSPADELEAREGFEVTTVQSKIEKMEHSVSQRIQPQSSSMEEIEPDEEDPVFSWAGGSPYGSGKPKFVIHKSDDEVDTLPFLQVLLRDTYKEMVGGEPDGETVEFVANEPRVPGVRNSIVTLDLTQGDWSADIRGGKPVIQRSSDDIVPKLREAVSTLYTGELGYFVVNAPAKWDAQADFVDERFFEKLVARLTDTEDEEEKSGGESSDKGVFDRLDSAPVVLAEPNLDEEQELEEMTARYFGFGSDEGFPNVSQTEEAKERVLRKNDWKRVAMTERQSEGDGESDEHYFWKSAIVEGIAWNMWRVHKSERDEGNFGAFIEDKILGEDILETEGDSDDFEEKGRIPDIKVNDTNNRWIDSNNEVSDVLSSFVGSDRVELPVYIEFETGRSEGSFNFRKIRDTVEKYKSDENKSDETVCVVVPPRLLFRGKRRAKMIVELVENGSNDAIVCVPVLNQSSCASLKPADTVVNTLYGTAKENDANND